MPQKICGIFYVIILRYSLTYNKFLFYDKPNLINRYLSFNIVLLVNDFLCNQHNNYSSLLPGKNESSQQNIFQK